MKKSEWLPYYGQEHPVCLMEEDERIKVSVWRQKGKILAVIASTDRATDLICKVSFPHPHLRDAMTNKTLSEDGTVSLCLRGFDFHFIIAKE